MLKQTNRKKKGSERNRMKNDKGKKGRERERGRSEPPKKKQAFALREKYNISTDDRAAVGISMDQVNVFLFTF